MALPEILPFTLGEITPGEAVIATTPGTPSVTAPGTMTPGGAVITTAPGTPGVGDIVEIALGTASVSVITGTPGVTAPTTASPASAVVSTAPGTPVVVEIGTGYLPWSLPIALGGSVTATPGPAPIVTVPGTPGVGLDTVITPGTAPITTTPGIPGVSEITPVQSPLPWTLPVVLGGAWTIKPAPAPITTTGGDPVISGAGFPYMFPFSFPDNTVAIYPLGPGEIITAPGTPVITGGTAAVTPGAAPIVTEPGAPIVTGPTGVALDPGSATIITEPGAPGVSTVMTTTTVFLVDGTQEFLDWGAGSPAPIGDNPVLRTLAALLDTETTTVQTIPWPRTFPMITGFNIGLNNLTAAIANTPNDFILVGYSEGAAICSMALQQMESGGLTNYADDLLGGVMFGNPCRQGGAIAPVQTDPGGHGVWATNLLTHTPVGWWEFALPLDIATTVPNSLFGEDISTMFNLLMGGYLGGGNLVRFLLDNLGNGIRVDAEAIGQLVLLIGTLSGVMPVLPGQIGLPSHARYYDTAPPGANQTCVQLAASYINQIAASKTVIWRTIDPGGAVVTTTEGVPFVADVITPTAPAGITATPGVPIVMTPVTVAPPGTVITATTGTMNQVPGLLPWTLPLPVA